MNILSLFDGISCGRLALDRAKIKVDEYYASEIDKYAITVTNHNFPNTIQLGDVINIDYNKLPKIDLLIGGSPCTGFSFAGKGLNFNDPKSKLFFEFVKALKILKPKYFLLENVKMKKEYQDVISKLLGVEPIEINSSLLSAQNRKRLYWTNIINIKQPKNKGILLKDILETSGEYIKISKRSVYKKFQDKASCLTAGGHSGGNHSDMDLIGQKLYHIGNATDIKGFEIIKRIYATYGKSPTVTTMTGGHRHPKIALNDYEYRRLTPIECEKLQTIPKNYTLVPYGKRMMSNSQRYKQIGNGWTVDIIAHIFKNIKESL